MDGGGWVGREGLVMMDEDEMGQVASHQPANGSLYDDQGRGVTGGSQPSGSNAVIKGKQPLGRASKQKGGEKGFLRPKVS